MRNRAKCKLCNDILESFHRHDYVTCKCGEISVDGGQDYWKCSAKDFRNFLRIDDEGNEVIVKVVEKENNPPENLIKEEINPPKMSKADQIEMLETMIKNIENLPAQAMTLPINHYDFCSFMLLLSSILKDHQ